MDVANAKRNALADLQLHRPTRARLAAQFSAVATH